jgi:hypothetical protein
LDEAEIGCGTLGAAYQQHPVHPYGIGRADRPVQYRYGPAGGSGNDDADAGDQAR